MKKILIYLLLVFIPGLFLVFIMLVSVITSVGNGFVELKNVLMVVKGKYEWSQWRHSDVTPPPPERHVTTTTTTTCVLRMISQIVSPGSHDWKGFAELWFAENLHQRSNWREKIKPIYDGHQEGSSRRIILMEKIHRGLLITEVYARGFTPEVTLEVKLCSIWCLWANDVNLIFTQERKRERERGVHAKKSKRRITFFILLFFHAVFSEFSPRCLAWMMRESCCNQIRRRQRVNVFRCTFILLHQKTYGSLWVNSGGDEAVKEE